MVGAGAEEASYSFPETPSCNQTYYELDAWPSSVDDKYVLDLSGHNVVIPASTTLTTGEHGLTIFTDCNMTVANTATLGVDGDADDARVALVARNLTVNGEVTNDADESGSVILAGLDSVTIGSTGVVSASNLSRVNNYGAARVEIKSLGDIDIAGAVEANETTHGGTVSITGDNTTFALTAGIYADGDIQENDSIGGTISAFAKNDFTAEAINQDHATFSAQGNTDGTIAFTGCAVDDENGIYDPTPEITDGRCPLTDIIDLEAVDWCEGYTSNDLCCQNDDPCGYGFDGVCQCGSVCDFDALDCLDSYVVIKVTDGSDGSPMEGAECIVVDNETGDAIDPEVSAIADANGNCALKFPDTPESFSIGVSKSGFVSAYYFNIPAPMWANMFLLSEDVFDFFAQFFEIEQDPQKGYIIGGVYWESEEIEEPVGCAEVDIDAGAVDTFYMIPEGLSAERTSTHPEVGQFLMFNVTAGTDYELTATVDLEEESAPIVRVFPNSVTLQRISFWTETYEENPTPSECE
jgi:hypothetical protein